MAEEGFIDYVRVFCRSGRGGAGSAHLRREKFNPKGGPDGGDGGRGGDVIIRGNANLWTLLHLKYTRHLTAGDGARGASNQKSGAAGADIVIEVPPGTVVRSEESGEQKLEIIADGEQKRLLRGGRGGLGNTHFKSAIRQTPRYAQPGEPGSEGWFIFELKVLADVGLVGFPNAGKSTLLSVVSAARPKIDDYPFTTLHPSLGIVSLGDHRSFVMADIPGIIEGAAEGKGLGHRFLRHIERNPVLLFMIAADSQDIAREYAVLTDELRRYNPELLDKKRVLAVTKCDLLDDELTEALMPMLPEGVTWVMISSVSGQGIARLKETLWRTLNTLP